jgi:hypothetical protein
MNGQITVEFHSSLFGESSESEGKFPPELSEILIEARDQFQKHLERNPELAEQTKNKLNNGATVKHVYDPCGTCSRGGGLVHVYVGSGGSDADYTFCKACP